MLSTNGTIPTILDATALIDFCWLNEWEWLESNYSPLYIAQEVLDSDQLEFPTREAAKTYLEPLNLSTEEMFASFLEFGTREPLLSAADRSTIAIARHLRQVIKYYSTSLILLGGHPTQLGLQTPV